MKCNKNITKKIPGLECSRCEKIVHADPTCSKLSNKQLNTIRNSPGIEWSCEECKRNVTRRSTFFIPDDDGEEDEPDADLPASPQTIDTRKLVQDISRELKKTFREEIGNLETSLEFLSEQICNMEHSIKQQASDIKKLENKNEDLSNKNKNLELRVRVLEQDLKTFEQQSLSTALEVAGLPEMPPNDVKKMVKTIALELNMDEEELQSSQLLPGSKDKPGPILVNMKSKLARKQWIDAGKEKCLTVGILLPDTPREKADNRVYIREALTKYVKTLLYNAKSQLRSSFEFIWCKDGKVCVRKTSKSKIHYIKCEQDIKNLLFN